MKNKIDLHGLSHENALIQVEEFLLMNSFRNDLELELITSRLRKYPTITLHIDYRYIDPYHNNLFPSQSCFALRDKFQIFSYNVPSINFFV